VLIRVICQLIRLGAELIIWPNAVRIHAYMLNFVIMRDHNSMSLLVVE
jgi:hypothetical protein